MIKAAPGSASDTRRPAKRPHFLSYRPGLPDWQRAALAAPLFDRPVSLMLGHVISLMFTLMQTIRHGSRLALLASAANAALLVARLVVLALNRRRRRSETATGAPIRHGWTVSAYMAIGVLWVATNGLFASLSVAPAQDSLGTVVGLTLTMGASGAIASRNAGNPKYAVFLIALWLIPGLIGMAAIGTWFWACAVMIGLYFISLCSVVERIYLETLALLGAERANAMLASRLDAALTNMSQGLLFYDSGGALQVANRAFHDLFRISGEKLTVGLSATEVLDRCIESGSVFHRLPAAHLQSLEALALDGAPTGSLELADQRIVAVSVARLDDGGLVSTYEDITERKRNEARIAHLARHDALTGLPNRTLFAERMEEAMERARLGEPFAVLCLDLDRFKAVNDTLGHAMGDRLLRAVASRLAGALRELDTVARLGGDEFAIILPAVDRAENVEQVASRLIEVVSQRYEIEGQTMSISLSVGAALAPEDGSTAEALLVHADLALYAAKAEGRGRACFFEQSLSQRIVANHELEQDLRDAVLRQEFELSYQPILELETRQVIGLEALMRWNHPSRGLVMPDQFIAYAEESGAIVPLGEWALCTACRQAATWPSPLTVAVNVSPVQFRSGSLIQAVARALQMSGLPPSRLEIEITEAAVLQETASTNAFLRELRKQGVRAALDNFGTGFSSLSSLHRFPFDKIKIDKSFIRDLDSRGSANAIVVAVVGLGKSLGMITTAEGVETGAQLARLQQLGCTQGQGYLFARPVRASAVPRLLTNPAMAVTEAALVPG